MQSVVVNVEVYGVVRDLVKEPRVLVDVSSQPATVRDILEALADRYGPVFRSRLFGNGGLLSNVKVYADGKPVEDLSQPLPAVEESAVRIIVMAAAGGG